MKKLAISMFLCISLALVNGCASTTPTVLVLAPPTATNNPVVANTPTQPVPTLLPTATIAVPTAATLTLAPTQMTIPAQKADWTFAAEGPIWSPINVSGGVVYFGSEDGFVYAVDTQSHAL
jgi:outer membrane protein assembly factor BamB